MGAFARASKLREEGIGVVAASVDPLDKTRDLVKELSLNFPVGYGLPVKETAEKIGAFYEETRGIIHTTGFLLKPDKTIAVAVYSSGPIGRLVWQDVLGYVQFHKARMAGEKK